VKLKEAQEKNDIEKIDILLQKSVSLNNLKKTLAKDLGERIILK